MRNGTHIEKQPISSSESNFQMIVAHKKKMSQITYEGYANIYAGHCSAANYVHSHQREHMDVHACVCMLIYTWPLPHNIK